MELLLGAGANHTKKLRSPDRPDWDRLVTLDFNPHHNPDVIHDLADLPYPFDDDTFDEIHAYEVMEHVGQQGDFRFFLGQWAELWRILKPQGLFLGTSPHRDSPWAWGDPGHTRIISLESLTFLNQLEYQGQVGITPMSDYRFVYKADFEGMHFEVKDGTFYYVLRAVKPSRIQLSNAK